MKYLKQLFRSYLTRSCAGFTMITFQESGGRREQSLPSSNPALPGHLRAPGPLFLRAYGILPPEGGGVVTAGKTVHGKVQRPVFMVCLSLLHNYKFMNTSYSPQYERFILSFFLS